MKKRNSGEGRRKKQDSTKTKKLIRRIAGVVVIAMILQAGVPVMPVMAETVSTELSGENEEQNTGEKAGQTEEQSKDGQMEEKPETGSEEDDPAADQEERPKISPVLVVEDEGQSWSNQERVVIAGYAFDENAPDAIPPKTWTVVWSRDQAMITEDVLTETEHRIPLDEEGHFSFESEPGEQLSTYYLYAVDGENHVSPCVETQVRIDQAAPEITSFSFVNAETSVMAGFLHLLTGADCYEADVEEQPYGYFFRSDTMVTITAGERKAGSGVRAITYFTVDRNGEKSRDITVRAAGVAENVMRDTSENEIADSVAENAAGQAEDKATGFASNEGKITIRIPAGFKGQIYAIAEDTAGNRSESYAGPEGVIVEDDEAHNREAHITFEKEEAPYRTAEGNALYAQNVPVTIRVTDSYSGIASVTWSVVAPFDTEQNQSGEVTIAADGSMLGEEGWKICRTEKNLVCEMERQVLVSNDSNEITLHVSMTDRTGHVTEQSLQLNIDKSAPVIEISYDHQNADEAYPDYFREERRAVVKITDQNFSENEVSVRITNTEGNAPAVSEWTKQESPETPGRFFYTAEVRFFEDGCYTVQVNCRDRAGNAAENVVGDGKNHRFIIDKTAPRITVLYEDTSSRNGIYYKKERTALIQIEEHNFDASRVSIFGTAADQDREISFPKAGAWVSNGDLHTAVLSYTEDGEYHFAIAVADKAGNVSKADTPDVFIIDKTAPQITFLQVTDQTSYRDLIAPVVEVTDTNFDPQSVAYTLSGTGNGSASDAARVVPVSNGQRIVFADFDREQEADGRYILTVTLTDLAGNESTGQICFSVNRYGSFYDLTQMTDRMGRFVRQEEDCIFTETNVDALRKGATRLKLVKNGIPADLAEGRDYTVLAEDVDGRYHRYTYTIRKGLFAEDARYRILICTEDEAGNVNENTDETKNAEISFGIDKTKPVIIPVNLESSGKYATAEKQVMIECRDNLALAELHVYLNGTEVEVQHEEETYTFVIPQKSELQNVRIIAVDEADNRQALELTDILVSVDSFVRLRHNLPLVAACVAGTGLLAAAVLILVVRLRARRRNG